MTGTKHRTGLTSVKVQRHDRRPIGVCSVDLALYEQRRSKAGNVQAHEVLTPRQMRKLRVQPAELIRFETQTQ